jgi:hypothetical protein
MHITFHGAISINTTAFHYILLFMPNCAFFACGTLLFPVNNFLTKLLESLNWKRLRKLSTWYLSFNRRQILTYVLSLALFHFHYFYCALDVYDRFSMHPSHTLTHTHMHTHTHTHLWGCKPVNNELLGKNWRSLLLRRALQVDLNYHPSLYLVDGQD